LESRPVPVWESRPDRFVRPHRPPVLTTTALAIPDLRLVATARHTDNRGALIESWNQAAYAAIGLDAAFVQDNVSWSVKNCVRALHYQLRHPQGKLVRCLQGAIFDVAVDVRRSSPTFGQWVGVRLDDERHDALWIPPGFAHGFCALTETVTVTYKVTGPFVPSDAVTIRWDDPTIGVAWPLDGPPVLSVNDAHAPSLGDVPLFP
jgi:dTDP-4-dehydrorhamnose 3,5-epimerase